MAKHHDGQSKIAYALGDVVAGTVIDIDDDNWLWLNVNGLVGVVGPQDLDLDDGESAQDRYSVGDTVDDLFVLSFDHEARDLDPFLDLSAKRNAPGYVEALQQRAIGDVVSGTLTDVDTDDGGWLWLDVDGLVGVVGPQELDLADAESAQGRYAVGETIDGLFVWDVDHEARCLRLSVKRNAPGYLEALQQHTVGNVVSGTITSVGDGLLIDVDGLIGFVPPWELDLDDRESAQDRYAVGKTIDGLFVWQVNHENRLLALSAKRNASGYMEALQRRAVGDVVSATVIGFQSNGGLWLDVDGLVGVVAADELNLDDGESAQDHYAVGETTEGLFVWDVDHETRVLGLSAKRNAPGYLAALEQRTVGEVVAAAVTGFQGNGGLWLDVDGLVGAVEPNELALDDGESARDRYAIGETIDGLFVCQVDHEERVLDLSTKRNAHGYLEALQQCAVGDVVSGTVTDIDDDGWLWLDVDGLVGSSVPTWELDLASEESARERYTVGETIDGLFVWDVEHDNRGLHLSAKRNAPGYVEALQQCAVGDVVSATVTMVLPAGLWLDVDDVVGAIFARELSLDDGESPPQRYSVGDTIAARVWMLDRVSRMVILSARRSAADLRVEPVAQGATIDAVVQGTTPRNLRMPIRVLTTYSDSSVEIPPHALSLSTGMPPRLEDRQEIRVVVTELDAEGRPTRLSHRQALDGWEAEMRRLSHDTLAPNARPVPPEALSDAELHAGATAVDLGPITGFVPEKELDRETGQSIATYNETYRVVVESVDYERRIATVSHDRFEERWRELAAGFKVGDEVEGELRDFDSETALLDLGSGLLAQMPARELPDSDPPGKAARDRIGELFPLRITTIDHDTQTIHVEPREQWIESLIGEPESETLEFKEVLRGDPSAGDAKEMTRQAMRTINAFLNTEGGRLIIGVHDTTREVVGLKGDPGLDADTIEKKIDQATQILETNLANLEPRDLLRDDLDGLVDWDTLSVRGGTLLMITCERGPEAGINLVIKGKPEFWVREGSSKKQLRTQSEIRDHLRTRQQRAATAGDAASDD